MRMNKNSIRNRGRKNDMRYSEKEIREAASIIISGGVIAFPTETVYGLGANAFDEKAVKKIFEIKKRPPDNPLIVHIADKKDIFIVGRDIPPFALLLAKKFWPGPLTMVIPKNPSIPDIVSGGLDTVAVRMPAHPVALKLIRLASVPIAAPSANPAGKPSATQYHHVKKYFGDKIKVLKGKVKIGIESTVIDLTQKPPVILRPGSVSKDEIEKVIGEKVIELRETKVRKKTTRVKSPGVKYRHYKPDGYLILIKGNFERKVQKVIEDLRKSRKIKIKEKIKERKWEGEGGRKKKTKEKRERKETKEKNSRKERSELKVAVVFSGEGARIRSREFSKKYSDLPDIKINTFVAGETMREIAKNLYSILIDIGSRYDVIVFEGVHKERDGLSIGIMNRLKKASDKVL